MKNAIRQILADQDDEVKFKEYNLVSSAAHSIKEEYNERIKKEKEEATQKEEKRKF